MAYHLKAAEEIPPAGPERRLKESETHVALRQVSITGQRYYRPGAGRWLRRDPIGTMGGSNLYVAMGNCTVVVLDALGLERLRLSYDMATDLKPFDKVMNPIGMKELPTMQEVLADISSQVDPFSASGKAPCNCVEHLTIAGHGAPGEINIGDGNVTPGLIEMWRRLRQMLEGSGQIPEFSPEEQFFEAVGGMLCDGAAVEFVTCSSGQSADGDSLREWLQDLLGPDVDITLYEAAVKYVLGMKICQRKTMNKEKGSK